MSQEHLIVCLLLRADFSKSKAIQCRRVYNYNEKMKVVYVEILPGLSLSASLNSHCFSFFLVVVEIVFRLLHYVAKCCLLCDYRRLLLDC